MASTAAPIDLMSGLPHEDLLAPAIEPIREALASMPLDYETLQYGPFRGRQSTRSAIISLYSEYLEGNRVHPEERNVFVTNGVSNALALLCSVLTKPGDTILVEAVSYLYALKIFSDLRLNIISVRTDPMTGIDLDDLESNMSTLREPPVFLYIIPTFNNPTGATLPPENRERLLKLSQKHKFFIFADEVYQFLHFDGCPMAPPPLWCYDIPEDPHVVSLNSFSKILAPAFRLGWIYSQCTELLERLTNCGVVTSGCGLNPFVEQIVTYLITTGLLQQHISKIRSILSHSANTMISSIRKHFPPGTVSFVPPQGGYFLWLRISRPDLATRYLEHTPPTALRGGAGGPVIWMPGSLCRSSTDHSSLHSTAIRLCFAHNPPPLLEEGISSLSSILLQS
ncbi:PLP-dependent aminotransferase family protein [Pelomyxa schiedti]|nr:PLP-dependent aminotransferase family protein [Pelomyxa schiedti]